MKKFKLVSIFFVLLTTTGCLETLATKKVDVSNLRVQQTVGKTTVFCSPSGCSVYDRRGLSTRVNVKDKD